MFYDDVDLNHLWSSGEHKTRDVKLKKNRIFLVNLKYKNNDVNLNIIIPINQFMVFWSYFFLGLLSKNFGNSLYPQCVIFSHVGGYFF